MCHRKFFIDLFITVNSDEIEPLTRKAIIRELSFRKYTNKFIMNLKNSML